MDAFNARIEELNVIDMVFLTGCDRLVRTALGPFSQALSYLVSSPLWLLGRLLLCCTRI